MNPSEGQSVLIASDDNDGLQPSEGLWIYGGNNGDWYLTTGKIDSQRRDRVPIGPTCRVRTSGSAQRPGIDMAAALLFHIAQGNHARAKSIAETLARWLDAPPRWNDGTPL